MVFETQAQGPDACAAPEKWAFADHVARPQPGLHAQGASAAAKPFQEGRFARPASPDRPPESPGRWFPLVCRARDYRAVANLQISVWRFPARVPGRIEPTIE